MPPKKDKWCELEKTISKMPFEMCTAAVPDFKVQWKEVSRAIRNTRLPMKSSSVARVLRSHLAETIPEEELDEILGRIRLRLLATQNRTWHVILLTEPNEDRSETDMLDSLPERVLEALRESKRISKLPVVHSLMLGEFVYLSVQFVSSTTDGSVGYMAVPPGQGIALLSAGCAEKIVKACVKGLGYNSYEVQELYGKDKESLVRIAARNWDAEADHLTGVPVYAPMPVLTSNGIDYTNRAYDEHYIDSIIGPDPPLLTELTINTAKKFFDPNILNKRVSITMTLKSKNVANSLRSWVRKGAIAPTSDLFQVFHRFKSNKITYRDEEDSD